MAYLGPAPANSIIATSDIEDGAVTSAKLGGNIVTPGTLDVNGQELILDANANTSITADTDDQIDIRIAGADDFQFTANTMSILSGSTLNIDSGATIANSGTATGFGLSVYTGSFTRDMTAASGSVAYTGVGFEPAAIWFWAKVGDQAGYMSWGFSDGASGGISLSDFDQHSDDMFVRSGSQIYMQGTTGNNHHAAVASLDSDGFTLTWTKYGSPTGTATTDYIAIA